MGIRGLTTYIAKNSDQYLEPYELERCTVVIDGNNIACQLYNWVSKCNSAFGGDYDKYANCIENFFNNLLKCEVKPLVVFDGGYETKKIPTVHERLKNKLLTAKSVNPLIQSKLNFFPLFMKDVFMDVLRSLNISFAQSDFEADGEIAAIARKLHCPVLSYDSDFYVFDVLYIPLSSLTLEPVKYIADDDKSAKYFISCKIYRIETFLNSLGGLDKALLPVVAVVLGNDYIEKQVLQNFLSQIKCPKSRKLNTTQRQIVGILQWLRHETLETAVTKILNRLKKNKRPSVSKQLREIISGYNNTTSILLTYLGIPDEGVLEKVHTHSKSDTYASSNVNHDGHTSEDYKAENEEDNDEKKEIEEDKKVEEEGEGNESEEMEDILDEEENQSKCNDEPNVFSQDIVENTLSSDLFPKWFIESFRQGDLPPSFVNMVVLKTHFFTPQIEKFSSVFSHNISLPIIGIIFGLLTSEFTEKKDLELNCVTYEYIKNAQLKNLTVLPVYRTRSLKMLPLLQNVPSLPENVRKSIICDVAELSSSDIQILNRFPNDWKVIIIALVYWARNVSEPTVSSHHIHALLFSLIMLNVVDSHTGYCRTKKVLLKVNGNKFKTNEAEKNDVSSQKQFSTYDSVTEAIAAVSKKDCVSVFDNILSFYMIEESLKSRPKLFCLEAVHIFAQFQSYAYFINHLNALLNFPFPRLQIAKFYSGTLIYNAYMNFRKHSNVESYICKHLLNLSSLGTLYQVLIDTIACFLPNLLETEEQKKTVHRKKKRKPKEKGKTKSEQNCDEESENSEVDELMKNNRFSALNLVS